MQKYNWINNITKTKGRENFNQAQFGTIHSKEDCKENQLSRLQMLEVVNDWNRQGKGVWIYWID